MSWWYGKIINLSFGWKRPGGQNEQSMQPSQNPEVKHQQRYGNKLFIPVFKRKAIWNDIRWAKCVHGGYITTYSCVDPPAAMPANEWIYLVQGWLGLRLGLKHTHLFVSGVRIPNLCRIWGESKRAEHPLDVIREKPHIFSNSGRCFSAIFLNCFTQDCLIFK